MAEDRLAVSIIVPAYNQAAMLEPGWVAELVRQTNRTEKNE